MPFKSEAQRRKLYALEAAGKLKKGTCEKWEAETPKGITLPERLTPKKAHGKGVNDALDTYGVKEAAMPMGMLGRAGSWLGKGMQWGAKALGFAPTGIGNAAGAVLGGAGGALQGLSQGEGWKGMAARAGVGAASGALPLGSGLAVGAVGNTAIDGAAKNWKRPTGMPNSIGQV
jgi:hypothetical protein